MALEHNFHRFQIWLNISMHIILQRLEDLLVFFFFFFATIYVQCKWCRKTARKSRMMLHKQMIFDMNLEMEENIKYMLSNNFTFFFSFLTLHPWICCFLLWRITAFAENMTESKIIIFMFRFDARICGLDRWSYILCHIGKCMQFINSIDMGAMLQFVACWLSNNRISCRWLSLHWRSGNIMNHRHS